LVFSSGKCPITLPLDWNACRISDFLFHGLERAVVLYFVPRNRIEIHEIEGAGVANLLPHVLLRHNFQQVLALRFLLLLLDPLSVFLRANAKP
jgi:hypothetical protein